jgi:NADPH:quinone reductase
MRALVLRSFGPPAQLAVEDLATPNPAVGEVRIRVATAGISFADALIVAGGYQIRPQLPWVPGSECAGVVDTVGGQVTDFSPGDRVCALAWGGVVAESLCVEASAVQALPEGMDFEVGAVIRVAYTTAWHALVDRAHLQPGEKLLVLGATGAVGYAAIQIGKALGALVIAAASTAEKRAEACSAGANFAVASDVDSLRGAVEAIAGRKAINVVIDPVGGPVSETAFRLLGWAGRHCIVGFAAGPTIPAIPLNLPLLVGGSVLGVNVSRYTTDFPDQAAANVQHVFKLFREKRVAPRIALRFGLNEAAAAFDFARQGRPSGRIVINL